MVEDFRSFWSAFYMHSMLMTPVITLEFLWLSTSYVIGCLCHLLVCIILILNQESDAAHHIVRACNEPCTWNNFCHFILKRTHHDLHVYYLKLDAVSVHSGIIELGSEDKSKKIIVWSLSPGSALWFVCMCSTVPCTPTGHLYLLFSPSEPYR